MSRRLLSVGAVVFLAAVPAAAQPREPRFSAWVGGGAQAAMPQLGDRFTFVMHAEDAPVDADYGAQAAPLVDGGFAVRLFRDVGVGVAVTRFSGDSRAAIVAQIPYPFAFNQFREVTGTSSALDHTELAYHAQLQYSRDLARRIRLVLSAGPTFFEVRRHLVTDVQVDEAYPFDTASFRSATARAAKGTGIGVHAGVDVVYLVGRHAGLGAMVRYARGTADLDGGSRSVTVDAGGVQSGVGLRLYF